MGRNKILEEFKYFEDEFVIMRTHYEIFLLIIPIVQKEALDKDLVHFFSFWWFDLRSHIYACFISLSKFFDKHPKSRTMQSILCCLNNPTLEKDYKNLCGHFLKYKNFRDKIIAHMDKTIIRTKPENTPSLSVPDLNHLKGAEFKNFINELHEFLSNVKVDITKDKKEKWFYFPDAIDDLKKIKEYLKKEISEIKEKSRRIN